MISESIVEDAALTWFEELGYAVGHGPRMASSEPAAERDSFGEVVLAGRLREAILGLNPGLPSRILATLLPKLLSGELSVARLEAELEGTVADSATVQTKEPKP